MDNVARVDIKVLNLQLHIEPKSILNQTAPSIHVLRDISFNLPSGKILGLMGGSGSGKTTLLNALAGKCHPFLLKGRLSNVRMEGTINFNDSSPANWIKGGGVAYVQQHDFLLPYLTVRETLQYAALLRLPSNMTRRKKFEIVEEVLMELGLKDAANTLIGDEWKKGISGGEKRRVSIGVQLLVNPSLIFMDEPTTGLDSFTSQSLFETLQNLTRKGRTVIVSIHQPRSAIFTILDKIILLSKGNMVYHGPSDIAVDYFQSLEYPVPEHMNIADYIIDISSIDNRNDEIEKITTEKVTFLVQTWNAKGPSIVSKIIETKPSSPIKEFPSTDSIKIDLKNNGATWIQQVMVLSERGLKNFSRDPLMLWGTLSEVFIVSIVVGLVFLNLDENLAGIQSRKSIFYLSTSLQPYLYLMFICYKLSSEIRVFDRERKDNTYSTSAYLLAWYCSNFLSNAIIPFIFSIFPYFMAGLRTEGNGSYFAVFYSVNLVMHYVLISFGYLCISVTRSFASASLLANSLYTFTGLAAGFFNPVKWIHSISYTAFGYTILSSNEFSNRQFHCKEYPFNDPRCSGKYILESQGLSENDYVYSYVGLVITFILYTILTLILLNYVVPNSNNHAQSIKQRIVKIKPEDPNKIDLEKGNLQIPQIDVEIKSLHLQITKKFLTNPPTTQVILENVNAYFPNGKLSVILGASGSGKSTLLNVLGGRPMQTSLFSKILYSHESILFNNQIVDGETIRSICSFVRQDDSHLMPALTARETLFYAALLRLPRHFTLRQKIVKSEEILVLLGLKDCGNTIVGDELTKGLSGGEKRRLSIGIQMLTEPSVLIIDEPTSGLDAFTANHLMVKLKEIASMGRTVICSIHQPRSDIVELFDQVLLLAKGGTEVYSGSYVEMIPYFQSTGHSLPDFTNSADFVIDLTSIDLRNNEAEIMTRERLKKLVQDWRDHRSNQKEIETKKVEKFKIENYKIMSSFFQAYPILLDRSITNIKRQPALWSARLAQVISLGIIFCLFFARVDNSQQYVQARIGLLQEISAVLFVGMLNCIAIFPQDYNLYKSEKDDKAYEIISAGIFVLIGVWAVGLQFSVANFFIYTYCIICTVNFGESLGLLFCSFVDHVGFSVQILSAIMSIFTIMTGFLSVKNMPAILDRINYISPLKWTSLVYAIREFGTLVFVCSESDYVNGTCIYTSGQQILDLLNFNSDQFTGAMIAVGVISLTMRLISILVLKLKE